MRHSIETRGFSELRRGEQIGVVVVGAILGILLAWLVLLALLAVAWAFNTVFGLAIPYTVGGAIAVLIVLLCGGTVLGR
jgi:sterol desaturase/sphingolipid hydroxylase (fatty acid hydroxylase superfamily)